MPFSAATISRKQQSRRFSVDLVVDSLPAALVPKRLRSASLPSPPSPHNPLAVPHKSALKRPHALSTGDLPSSEPFRIQFPSPADDLTEEVKLALSLEAELVQTTSLVAEICASIREIIPLARRRRRVYSMSREEHREAALRRHANLPRPPIGTRFLAKCIFLCRRRRRGDPPSGARTQSLRGVILCDPIPFTYFTREISPLLFSTDIMNRCATLDTPLYHHIVFSRVLWRYP
ncbi:hypothetical protein C8R47DRAFT_1231279 [Mycena vitilis]|nr:hypothetical protein C8R47DRAFT_1231279 [Mycena vitilis]